MGLWIAAVLASIVGFSSAAGAAPPLIGAAGVPRDLGATRDYDRIFRALAEAGVTLFYPIFQYQEAPTAETLGFEVDFIAPCRRDDPAFAALRRHGVRLIAPGNLLYQPGAAMPPLSRDPLAALIACAGRDAVYGVLSYDEPAHNGVSAKAAEAFYRRVKQVDPTLPVLMVHAPLIIEEGGMAEREVRDAYLGAVAELSQFADVIGFSTYPIPPEIAKMGSPFRGEEIVDHKVAAQEYVAWLRAAAPDKRYMAVLQSFSYADQFSPELLAVVAPPEVRDMVHPPSARELEEMATISVDGGADLIVWYGAGFSDRAAAQGWRDVLAVSRRLGAKR